MKKIALALALAFGMNVSAQQSVKDVIIVNGGAFGQPENVSVQLYDPFTKQYETIDTIQTQSVQNVLVEGEHLFVVAQDTVAKYDLSSRKRMAANKVTGGGFLSGISVGLLHDRVLIGNWYGSTSENVKVLDRNDLSVLDSLPLTLKAADIIPIGDSVYISQNYTSSGFSDSAGFVLVADTASLSNWDTIPFNYNGSGAGRLFNRGGKLVSLLSGTNRMMTYDPSTGAMASDSLAIDISVNGYGTQSIFMEDTLMVRVPGAICKYDLVNEVIWDSVVKEGNLVAFEFEAAKATTYYTRTDFFSFVAGGINTNGNYVDSLKVSKSPEGIGLYMVQNRAPWAMDDNDSIYGVAPKLFDVVSNDQDYENQALTVTLVPTTPPNSYSFGNVTLSGQQIQFLPFGGVDSVNQLVAYSVCDNGTPVRCDTATLRIGINTKAPVAISEQQLNTVSVYPNPSNGLVYFQNLTSISNVLLFDISGKSVAFEQGNNSIKIDRRGIYLLTIQENSGEVSTHRVVVK